MESIKRKTLYLTLTHAIVFGLGILTFYLASEPARYIWGFFLGSEVTSQRSFPTGHIAIIYSAWGFGEQRLIFTVDGKVVHRMPDFAPGDVKADVVWNDSGKIVTFFALEKKLFTYDAHNGEGYVEY